ncbi:PDZ domain-containing protein [Kangiella sediminilitoris]|uniref:PDZ/DHR/GLGF domain protein n=1 Tax=Kangiella sediminilitoris TaxID=1144748 RepID=A0A1B3BDX8_9GAMM|nr:PDZ domain-containing protein [Kangiella sediminilitoris]AOE50907.1 PDZ/DHR/GLGF domain protein [Kangiella sediminilitoris]
MKKIIIVLFAVAATMSSSALLAEEEKGSLGFSGNVGVDGIFNPEISSFEVDGVVEGSAAEAAGLKKGQKVVAIEDCRIPGCDTDDAQELMEVAPGEELILTVQDEAGEEKQIVIKAR